MTERGWPYYRGGSKARFYCINLTVYYAGALCRVSLHRVLEYCKWNKMSQVECPFLVDGIMVQMMPDAITKLRSSLKEMKDYTITTGIPGGGGEEEVIVEWVSRKDAPRQSRYKTRVYSELCLWWGPCGHQHLGLWCPILHGQSNVRTIVNQTRLISYEWAFIQKNIVRTKWFAQKRINLFLLKINAVLSRLELV